MTYDEKEKDTDAIKEKILPRLVKATLLEVLAECEKLSHQDREVAHSLADDALLSYIDDSDIKKAYNSFEKWYA